MHFVMISIYEKIRKKFKLSASSKLVKKFFKGTPSGDVFSSFLCYKVNGKNGLPLKTSLSHNFLKG